MRGNKRLYFFKGRDPFEHLAAEDFLLRSGGEGLAFWVARPCVVMGRFQNPWREVHWQKLGSVDLVRRQSGGGCVYQDEGNLNFAFWGPLKNLDKSRNMEIVRKALGDFGVKLSQNERFDLMHGKFKVSGNAFKQTKDRFLHHGTLLVDADLEKLGYLLDPPKWDIQTKALESRRSPVANLGRLAKVDIDQIVPAVGEAYGKGPVQRIDPGELSRDSRFRSEDWIWGETPDFTWKVGSHALFFKKARVDKIVGPRSSELEFLKGVKVWEKAAGVVPKGGRQIESFFNLRAGPT